MSQLRSVLATVTVSCLSLAACASQVDGDHQGTPLATLAGSVTNTRAQTPSSADVVVLWVTDGMGDFVTAETVPVQGSFPAAFSLALYEPPADIVLNAHPSGGPKVGLAMLSAAEPGQTPSDATPPLGLDPDHLLVYLPEDVTAGTFASYFLHGPAPAGFHIYGFNRLTDAERQQQLDCRYALGDEPSYAEIYTQCGGDGLDEVVPLATDLGTPLGVQLVDDLDSLDLANWM